jgi:hypothetical protein
MCLEVDGWIVSEWSPLLHVLSDSKPRATPLRYQEQPVVPPHFAHLWQLLLRTISDPQRRRTYRPPSLGLQRVQNQA